MQIANPQFGHGQCNHGHLLIVWGLSGHRLIHEMITKFNNMLMLIMHHDGGCGNDNNLYDNDIDGGDVQGDDDDDDVL